MLPICSYSQDSDSGTVLYSVPDQRVKPVVVCPWDSADIQERVALWQDMSPRHRDYHWRLMSTVERKTFRTLLPTQAQLELKNRFSVGHPKAYIVKTNPSHEQPHISKEERIVIRQQIQQARQAQAIQIDQYKTPAQIEHEQQLRVKIDQLHEQLHDQIMVVSLQKQQEKKLAQSSADKSKDHDKHDHDHDHDHDHGHDH